MHIQNQQDTARNDGWQGCFCYCSNLKQSLSLREGVERRRGNLLNEASHVFKARGQLAISRLTSEIACQKSRLQRGFADASDYLCQSQANDQMVIQIRAISPARNDG